MMGDEVWMFCYFWKFKLLHSEVTPATTHLHCSSSKMIHSTAKPLLTAMATAGIVQL